MWQADCHCQSSMLSFTRRPARRHLGAGGRHRSGPHPQTPSGEDCEGGACVNPPCALWPLEPSKARRSERRGRTTRSSSCVLPPQEKMSFTTGLRDTVFSTCQAAVKCLRSSLALFHPQHSRTSTSQCPFRFTSKSSLFFCPFL